MMRSGSSVAVLVATVGLLSSPSTAQVDPALLAGLEARAIGPAGMSGRVAAIAARVDDPTEVWVGAATGGLWKSTNAGLTWEAMFDDQPVAAIGAIALCERRPGVVWVGTGEGNTRNSVSVGDGLYRSDDDGRTWRHLGLRETERIHRILIHPDDPDTVVVAALGKLWGENTERGVFKTTDGGKTWDHVLAVDERTGCADLVVDPSNPDRMFAAMWEHRRWPWSFRSGGPGSGLWRTLDGGSTWTKLSSADGLPKGDLGRIGLAIAPSNPDVVYALVEAKKNALLRSDDGGFTFRTVNDDSNVAPRPFYYADIRVDPQNENRVYNLASLVTVSDDGGKTFSTLVPWSAAHPDHHAMWIDPNDGRHILDGNDGGVYQSRDRGKTWDFVANLPLAQFYHVRVDMDVPYHVYGGMQDNGSWRGPSTVWENGGIRNHHWQEVGFGDGFDVVPDPEDSMQGYAMSQQGFVQRYDLRTGERRDVRPPAPADFDGELRFNWNAAIAIDPFDPATIYFGSQFVHRSTNRGRDWEVISTDLTTNNPAWQKQAESGGLTLDVTGAENFTSLIVLAPSPVKKGVLWAASDDGLVHVTRDGGGQWRRVDGNLAAAGLPANTWCPHLEPSRFEAGTAFAVFDDHRRSNGATYVYRTDDFGQTWTSIVREPVRGYALALAQDPVDRELLFLGTEFGLWFTADAGTTWSRFDHGVPTVSCMDLVVHPRDHDLVVGTHGRAAFVIDDVSPLRTLDEVAGEAFHVFPIPNAQQYRVRQTDASRFPGNEEWRGDTESYGAAITLWFGGDALPHPDPEVRAADEAAEPSAGDEGADEGEGDGDDATPDEVEVAVYEALGDENGALVCRFDADVHRGLNRVFWNLRSASWKRASGNGDDGPPTGPEVLPGRYRVAVTWGERSASREVTVLPDPRILIEPDARRSKWDTLARVRTLNDALVTAVERLDALRGDLDLAITRAADRDEAADHADGVEGAADVLKKAAKPVREAIDAAEEQIRTPSGTKGITKGDHASSAVRYVSRSLQSSWDAPTSSQLAYLVRAEARVVEALGAVNAVLAGEAVAAFRVAVEANGGAPIVRDQTAVTIPAGR